MALTISTLFDQMNTAGLAFGRSPSGELEVRGDLSRLTDGLRQGIGEHSAVQLACLPPAAPAAPPGASVAIQAADGHP